MNQRLAAICARWSVEDRNVLQEALRRAASQAVKEAFPSQQHKPLDEFMALLRPVLERYRVAANDEAAIRDGLISVMVDGHRLKPADETQPT